MVTTKELPYAGSNSPPKHSSANTARVRTTGTTPGGSFRPETWQWSPRDSKADRSTTKEHGSNHAGNLKTGRYDSSSIRRSCPHTSPGLGHSWCQSEQSADLCRHGKGALRTAHQQPLKCQQQLAPSPHHTGPPHYTHRPVATPSKPTAAGLPSTAANRHTLSNGAPSHPSHVAAPAVLHSDTRRTTVTTLDCRLPIAFSNTHQS